MEEFAVLLSEHFLKKYNHVIRARVYIEEKPWQRIEQVQRGVRLRTRKTGNENSKLTHKFSIWLGCPVSLLNRVLNMLYVLFVIKLGLLWDWM